MKVITFYSYLRFDRPPLHRIRCLPFDRIGARHLGMTHGAGASPPANTRPCCCVDPQNLTMAPDKLRGPDDPTDERTDRKTRLPAC